MASESDHAFVRRAQSASLSSRRVWAHKRDAQTKISEKCRHRNPKTDERCTEDALPGRAYCRTHED